MDIRKINLDDFSTILTDLPLRNTAGLVAVSSLLFYAAEHGRNPKVTEIWDATTYCSTCLSVGYGDIFAKTPIGKIIGTMLMTIGPAMANKALEGPAAARDATQAEILSTLKQILEKVKTTPATANATTRLL